MNEKEDKEQQEPTEPEHDEFRNPDGTFKPGHPFRWQPGESGNPEGHTKGVPHFKKLNDLMVHLAQQPCTRKGYKKLTWGEAFVKRLFEFALEKGNPAMCKEILDRIDGTVKQVHEVEANSKTILTFEIAKPPNPEQHKQNGENGKLNGLTKKGES